MLPHRGIGCPPFPPASPGEGLPSTTLPYQGCRMLLQLCQCLEPVEAHVVPALIGCPRLGLGAVKGHTHTVPAPTDLCISPPS